MILKQGNLGSIIKPGINGDIVILGYPYHDGSFRD
jgi:hypothetical protein